MIPKGTVPYLLQHYLDMKEIVELAQREGDFSKYWDDFWYVSGLIQHTWWVDWYDPDTSEEEDMMARFNAVKHYIEREVL